MARFMQKGTSKVRYAPTIASGTLVPTAAEITAGTDLTPQVSEISGFTFANSPIGTPDMATTFVSNIPGEDTAETSSITFYEDKSSNPIRTALAKGTVGYIVMFPSIAGANPAAGDKCDVWPIIVASNARIYSAGNEASKYQVVFAVTAVPGFDKTVT